MHICNIQSRTQERFCRRLEGAEVAAVLDAGRAPGVSLGLAVAVPADLVATCQVALTLSGGERNKDAGGTPALPGPSLSSNGGDGRVGAGDRYFFMNIDAQDAQDFSGNG